LQPGAVTVLFRVVIPARYGSVRLPGKVLHAIGGKPLLQWVYERACEAGAQEVLIATDDDLIVSAAHSFGATTVMTERAHASGTDRIAEVARIRGWGPQEIVINLQGDEPLMPPALIRQVATLLDAQPQADIATLAAPLEGVAQLLDPNVVKVVSDVQGRALYFSRAPIPWNRDGAAEALASQRDCGGARRHVGLYAYRVRALLRLAQLPPGALEQREKLEQLRALENQMTIWVGDSEERPGPDVNTFADLQRVTALLTQRKT
jgi:3-deoxy-manno-octulosonate cytidylyltransferase (CMP-KDO synthetase)